MSEDYCAETMQVAADYLAGKTPPVARRIAAEYMGECEGLELDEAIDKLADLLIRAAFSGPMHLESLDEAVRNPS